MSLIVSPYEHRRDNRRRALLGYERGSNRRIIHPSRWENILQIAVVSPLSLKVPSRVDRRLFKETFCEDDERRTPAAFGTSKLRKLLIVVMRNATTGSPWPLSNHASAMFNDYARDDCNLNIPLWQILRASTAAPSFFPPQEIEIGGKRQLFVDGAVTPYNNPALLAFLMTTLPCYGVRWPTGRDQLSLLSIGTGFVRAKLRQRVAGHVTLLNQLSHAIPALIGAVATEQDLLCRVLGECVFGDEIDVELGRLQEPTLLPPEAQLFRYARYDLRLDQLQSRRLGRAETQIDNLRLIPMLQEIGREYAEQNVELDRNGVSISKV